MASKNTKQQVIIHRFANNSHKILAAAFKGNSPAIAAHFTTLGKPMADRTVRKMFKRSKDVRRRNMLENTCLLLGAARMDSPRSFEIIWNFLNTYADKLRGQGRAYKSIDEAFSEVRYANASLERKFYLGELKGDPQPLLFAEESLRGLLTHIHIGEPDSDDCSMFSILDFPAGFSIISR